MAMTTEAIGRAVAEHGGVPPAVGDRLPGRIVPKAPRARTLGNVGVGHNHIDVEAAATNTPGCLTDDAADLVVTLTLMVARRAGEGERELHVGRRAGWRPTHTLGRRLSVRMLGPVGMGQKGG